MSSELNTQEELDKHFLKCYTNFSYYAKHNLKIHTKESGLIPFVLNEVQVILEEIEADIISAGRFVRMYILKARQEGVSTWKTGKDFWKVSNNKNKHAAIITHEPPATQELFDMQKRFYKHLELEFKPSIKRNNMKMLQFDNDNTTGLDSYIKVATAGVKDYGSGSMIHYLHISELSKWPRENEGDLLTSLLQCVPDEPDTDVTIESTAKGVGGEFYRGFWGARYYYEIYLDNGTPKWKMRINKDADPANIYSSIFIPWFVFKKYRMIPPSDFKRTVEEEIISIRYGLDDEQLYWYRFILANKCKGNRLTRDQEYPMTAKSAFIGSGRPAFNLEQIMELIETATPPLNTYSYNQSLSSINEDKEGPLSIWEHPKPGISYLISADVAEGLEHGDFDSATVWNHMTGVQVAKFHGHLSPFRFANLLYFLGKMYNDAWIVPERNNHGISVVEKLLEMEYPNLYVEMVEDPPHKPRRRFGWVTTSKSRTLMIDHLINDVAEGTHGIKCREDFEEMINFKTQADGKIEADTGTFDDRVMDVAIGKYCIKALPYVISYYFNSHNIQSDIMGSVVPRTQTKPSVSAWN